ELVEAALREAGFPVGSVAELATVDARAEEPGIVAAAERLGVPLVTYSAEELAAVVVPNPSAAPLAAVGTPSVAEAAALLGGGDLLVPKRKSARATCAVVRRPGPGPGRAGTAADDRVTAGVRGLPEPPYGSPDTSATTAGQPGGHHHDHHDGHHHHEGHSHGHAH
ncbi:cobalamin biosynthesis protein, partial [Streptomyces sp. SID161]|uniref:cobalamin biosynthesis protein n=1 Tax=Streptomyces sp. SID161 TaxID=2690251 RepID=UPI001368B058